MGMIQIHFSYALNKYYYFNLHPKNQSDLNLFIIHNF